MEQAVGWRAFSVLMLAFGLWLLVYGIASVWKGLDPKPDVDARTNEILFHPAVHPSPMGYGEVESWSIEFVNKHPVLWLHLAEKYWSLQGFFPRKTIKLEGSKEQLESLVAYFDQHPVMSPKFKN